MRSSLLLLALLPVSLALEAKWTPASDGGPARFSKRHRDAAGIDDSRWTGEGTQGGGASWMPAVLPETPAGWILALCAAAAVYYLYQQQQPQANYARDAGGGGQRRPPGEASEAARAAFLKKFEQS